MHYEIAQDVRVVPIIKLHSSRKSGAHVNLRSRDYRLCRFLLLSRFVEYKIQVGVSNPSGFPEWWETVKKTTRIGVGNSRPENRNFCSFHRVSLPSPAGTILAMALWIDFYGRSTRSIVLESALWYVASYYLVIMLRVEFSLFTGGEETAARESYL